jgi:hypothetical protein
MLPDSRRNQMARNTEHMAHHFAASMQTKKKLKKDTIYNSKRKMHQSKKA